MGNDPRSWAFALALFAGSLLFVWLMQLAVMRRVANARETPGDLDDLVLELVRKTRLWLIACVALHLGFRSLVLPVELARVIRSVAVIALLVQGGVWVVEIVDFWLRRYKRTRLESDPSAITTIRAFGFAMNLVIWLVVLLAAIENLGFDVTTLVAGLGIGGIAIALATQNILGDLFASLSIVLDKPFVVGDVIQSGSDVGTVEYIGLKTTRLRAVSGEQLILSNADLLQSRVRNFERMKERRMIFTFTVDHASSEHLEVAGRIARAAIEEEKDVRLERAYLKRILESGFEFEVSYFVLRIESDEAFAIQERVLLRIVRGLREKGIDFAQASGRAGVSASTGV